MIFTDSHCHLEAKDFVATDENATDERALIIERARAAGVQNLVCIGSGGTIEQIDNAVRYAESDPHIWAAVGIHPHDAGRLPDTAYAHVEALASDHPRVVAVGEIGLDYYYDHSTPEAQQRVFTAFLQIAQRTNQPVVLHIRDAHNDARRLLAETPPQAGGVVHCFTGTRADAEIYVAMGLHVSFSGIVTFKSASTIRDAASWLPLHRMLIETDCPYLAPVPFRGKRNEPALVVHTARFLAELRGVPLAELAATTTANAEQLFGLTPRI